MYFKKISPSTTDLYSDASILPRSTHAASQICFSKPISLVLRSAIRVFLPCPQFLERKIVSKTVYHFYGGYSNSDNQRIHCWQEHIKRETDPKVSLSQEGRRLCN